MYFSQQHFVGEKVTKPSSYCKERSLDLHFYIFKAAKVFIQTLFTSIQSTPRKKDFMDLYSQVNVTLKRLIKSFCFFSAQIPCVESRDAYMTWGDIGAFLKCVIFRSGQHLYTPGTPNYNKAETRKHRLS